MEVEIDRKTMLALVLFVLSTSILFSKLIFPPSVQLIIIGEKSYVKDIPNVYTFTDVLILIASSSLMTASAFYLFNSFQQEQKVKKDEDKVKDKVTGILKGNEKKIYEILVENDGVMFQSEIVEKSSLPKSTVSLTLDKLEAKGLVERRRNGMSNVVILKTK